MQYEMLYPEFRYILRIELHSQEGDSVVANLKTVIPPSTCVRWSRELLSSTSLLERFHRQKPSSWRVAVIQGRWVVHIAAWLSHDFHMTVTWLSHDCHMTVTWLSHGSHITSVEVGHAYKPRDITVGIMPRMYFYLLQVIVLYEGILPAGSSFTTQASSLHGIPSVETLGMSASQGSPCVCERQMWVVQGTIPRSRSGGGYSPCSPPWAHP